MATMRNGISQGKQMPAIRYYEQPDFPPFTVAVLEFGLCVLEGSLALLWTKARA